MNPIEIVQTVGMAGGVADVREVENHHIKVTFHDDRTPEHIEKAEGYLESAGYERADKLSYKKYRYRRL